VLLLLLMLHGSGSDLGLGPEKVQRACWPPYISVLRHAQLLLLLLLLLLFPRSGPDLGLGPEKVRREIQLQARLSHVNIVELKQVRLGLAAKGTAAAAAAAAAY
jgi:hypothetical protein